MGKEQRVMAVQRRRLEVAQVLQRAHQNLRRQTERSADGSLDDHEWERVASLSQNLADLSAELFPALWKARPVSNMEPENVDASE